MKPSGVCPVCESPWEAPPLAVPARLDDGGPGDPSAGGTWWSRVWQSGQGPVALAALLFGLATVLPLVRDVHFVGRTVSVSLMDVVLDRYPLVGRFAGWLVLGAGLFLVSLLFSRRTAAAMTASRPMLLVISLAPVVGAALPFLRLRRYGQVPGVGPAVALIAAGVVLGVVGALRFGEGVPVARRRDGPNDDG